MKKIISKILIILLLIIILFEFTFSSSVCHAIDIRTDAESWINRITGLMGGFISIKLWIIRLQATGIMTVALETFTNTIAESCGISDDEFFDWSGGKPMTPFDIFFNKYKILDINFFEISKDNFISDLPKDNIINNLRKSVATWYFTLRNLSVAILMCVLIYVGIRMALSTVANEKAKYQTMLYDWVCSIILIFVLHYIIIFTIEANNAIIKFIRESLVVKTEVLSVDFVPGTYTTMDGLLGRMALQATAGIGMGSFIAIAALLMIVFQTISFFIAYMKRVLKLAFLIIIAPLISVTYSIDKIGDGKAQALNAWLKEFVYTILIQPFHAILYMAFANTAMAILTTTNSWLDAFANIITGEYSEIVNAVLVILCLKFVNDGENIIRKIFAIQEDDSTKTSLAAGAVVGLAALNTMKKGAEIGTKAAGLVSSVKALPIKFDKFSKVMKSAKENEKWKSIQEKFDKTGIGKKLKDDNFKSAFQDSKWGKAAQKVGGAAKWGADKIGGVAKWTGDKAMRAINGVKKFAKGSKFVNKYGKKLTDIAKSDKFKDGWKNFKDLNKRYLPHTLALMGAAMSYSTGSSGVMQAIGVGNAFKKSAEGYFDASGGNLAGRAGDALIEQAKASDEEYQEVESNLGKNAYEALTVADDIAKFDKEIQNTEGHKEFEAQWRELKKKQESGEDVSEEMDKLKSKNEKLYNDLERKEKLEKRQADLTNERKQLEDKKKEIEKRILNTSPDTLRKMIDKMDFEGSTGQIEKTKSEVLKMIQQAMMDQKRRDAEGENATGPMTEDERKKYALTDEENFAARAMQERMILRLDRDALGVSDKVNTTQAALEMFGSENMCTDELAKAFDSYRSSKYAAEYCTARDHYMEVGGDEESFRYRTAKKATGKKFEYEPFLDPIEDD